MLILFASSFYIVINQSQCNILESHPDHTPLLQPSCSTYKSKKKSKSIVATSESFCRGYIICILLPTMMRRLFYYFHSRFLFLHSHVCMSRGNYGDHTSYLLNVVIYSRLGSPPFLSQIVCCYAAFKNPSRSKDHSTALSSKNLYNLQDTKNAKTNLPYIHAFTLCVYHI